MAGAVHDATGKSCRFCGKEFNLHSFNLDIPVKEGKMIVYKKSCGCTYRKEN